MDRACPPEETFERVSPYLRQFGIMRLARHTGLDRIGVPVWCAYAPNSRSIVVAQGKGLTDSDARTSAVMEGLERAVAGDPGVASRFTDRATLLSEGAAAEPLGELLALGRAAPADSDMLDWLPGHELIQNQPAYVPRDAALLDRTRRDNRYWMSSDGLASGNTTEEAMLHGILERIERDAFVLWQVTSVERRYRAGVRPEAFADDRVAELADRLETAGFSFRLFEITSDIGVPTFSCFLAPCGVETARQARYVDVSHGCGAHPDPVRAVVRAMTEAAQSRMTFISGARDDAYPETFELPLPEETRQAFMTQTPARTRYEPFVSPGVYGLLDHVLDLLRKAKVPRVVCVPLQAPGLPFSVVKTFIPALENPDDTRARRFGPRALAKALLS